MRRTLLPVLSLLALTACFSGNGGPSSSSSSQAAQSSSYSSDIAVSQPQANATVQSPLTVTGEARGTWYFEASFPVRLLDGNGTEIAVVPAQAQSDWMTTDYVPYQAILIFQTPSTATGTLVLEKDNPSGEPQNAASVSIPVQF